mmetsp:Transcript_11499/g.27454  ORF Transcript_11499/g.27454 Transcript_11499/m.27454 type:complete len:341 (+) Transcript_11499:390-1412(+)
MLSKCSRRSLYQIVVSITLYTWTVLAFPGQLHCSTTTSARGLNIPLLSTAKTFTRRIGRRTFLHQAVLERATSISSDETESGLSSSPASNYEKRILDFLSTRRRNSSSCRLEDFHVQGWRWHTKSLARDAARLQKLALKTEPKNALTLKEACDFVVDFNMMGLHKIEATLFFPWMKEKLTAGTSQNPDLRTAFSSAMDSLENDRVAVASLGNKILTKSMIACDTKATESRRAEAIAEVAKQSAELSNLVQRMISVEDTLLVPAIGAIVPTKEQKAFNNKVLMKLGLLDSRLHLVGMYEAVWEGDDSREKELFQETIPGISRKMIPRWKRKLYQPKTYMME